MADALHFILAFFLAATTIVFFAKAMRLGVVFAPVGELARRIGRANALRRIHGKIFRHERQIKTTYLNPFKMTDP